MYSHIRNCNYTRVYSNVIKEKKKKENPQIFHKYIRGFNIILCARRRKLVDSKYSFACLYSDKARTPGWIPTVQIE